MSTRAAITREFIAAPVLLLPWLSIVALVAIGTVCAYLWWFALTPPSYIVYQHPRFTEVPVTNAEEAEHWEITTARPGQTIYRYQEYCLRKHALGIVRRQWTGAVVYPVPDKRNVGEVGCFRRSFAERAPDVSRTTEFDFQLRIDYPDANPLRVISLEYQPMPLTVSP